MTNGIKLSKKHGLNPSLMQCFVCMEDFGVALFGKVKGDKEAPMRVCLSDEPCDKCKDWMKQGVIVISVDEEKTKDPANPWRTGGWAVLRDEAIKRMIQPESLAEQVLKQRVCFIPDEAWDMLGLPRGETNAGDTESTS